MCRTNVFQCVWHDRVYVCVRVHCSTCTYTAPIVHVTTLCMYTSPEERHYIGLLGFFADARRFSYYRTRIVLYNILCYRPILCRSCDLILIIIIIISYHLSSSHRLVRAHKLFTYPRARLLFTRNHLYDIMYTR